MEYCSSQKDGNYLVLLKIEQVVWKKIEPGIGGPLRADSDVGDGAISHGQQNVQRMGNN